MEFHSICWCQITNLKIFIKHVKKKTSSRSEFSPMVAWAQLTGHFRRVEFLLLSGGATWGGLGIELQFLLSKERSGVLGMSYWEETFR